MLNIKKTNLILNPDRKSEQVSNEIWTWILWQFKLWKTGPIARRRLKIARHLNLLFNSTVHYGLFHDLQLTTDSWWGGADRSAVLLGLYEKEVLDSLTHIPKKYNTFIDLGAADGYYGIGVLLSNLFEKSYCFEISEKGQEVIRHNALLNQVSDRIEIHGIADANFYKQLSQDELERSVLFIDIEGGEFDLLTKAMFNVFKKSVIFVELHDWLFDDGDIKLTNLKNNSLATHTFSELTTKSRDLSQFNELKKFSDTDRWLICSEGRGQLMTWLRFDPLQDHVVSA